MAIVMAANIGVEPNEVIVVLESNKGPVNLHFPAAGAARFARDMSIAATQAMKLTQLSPSKLEPEQEVLVAPRATLEDYGEDVKTGDVVLRLRDEEGVLHIFRSSPDEVIEFARQALLHAPSHSVSH
jgi:hypothetical protein